MATITFLGKPVHTSGDLPSLGSRAPGFQLANGKLANVDLDNYAGKRKVLNIVPSLDTPVCAASARKFNEKAGTLDRVVTLQISADLPFAQCRFCELEGLKNIIPLSSFRSAFADDYGVRLIDSILAGLMARAVLVLDDENTVLHAQLVKELTQEPDYDSVLAVLSNS